MEIFEFYLFLENKMNEVLMDNNYNSNYNSNALHKNNTQFSKYSIKIFIRLNKIHENYELWAN